MSVMSLWAPVWMCLHVLLAYVCPCENKWPDYHCASLRGGSTERFSDPARCGPILSLSVDRVSPRPSSHYVD